jgi:hypothetical protein
MIEEPQVGSVPLYSVGTWDCDSQAFTPQAGLLGPSINITKQELRRRLKELRRLGYPCDRVRWPDGSRDSDPYVLVERTDGADEKEVLESWKR